MNDHHYRAKTALDTWLTLPVSVIIGSLIIGASIYISLSTLSFSPSQPIKTAPAATAQNVPVNVRAISNGDHVTGNRNAKVVLVEYSDLECPFCKTYHQTISKIMGSYGKDIALVYRHNPLSIHPKAQKEAEASECAAELGGNDAFWSFINRVFAITPSNNQLDPAELPKIAVSLGLDEKAFKECLASGKYAARVSVDQSEAMKSGLTSTPSSVIITKNGSTSAKGALPYEKIESLIKEALAK